MGSLQLGTPSFCLGLETPEDRQQRHSLGAALWKLLSLAPRVLRERTCQPVFLPVKSRRCASSFCSAGKGPLEVPGVGKPWTGALAPL